jgi:lysophospholipase L1-like esterase
LKSLRVVLKILVVAGSLLLSLAAAEAYVRWFRSDLVDTNVLRARLTEGSIAPLIQPTNSPGLIYELKPNNSTRLLTSQINTGPEGYRIDPDATPPAAGAGIPRIAVLGDSTSFGWGVEFRQSYPELVRSRLEARTGGAIDLRNYSIPGYNSEQELALFLQKVIAYQPDLLVLHHDPNDSEPVGFGFNLTPEYLAPEYGDNALSSSLLKFVLRELRIRQNRRAFEQDNNATLISGSIAGGALYDRHLRALESMASAAKGRQTPIVAILFNSRIAADNRYQDSEIYQVFHRGLQERLEAMGFLVLALFPLSQAKMKQEGWTDLTPLWRFPGDAHPNPAGHRLIADALTEYISNQPLLISRLASPARPHR